MKFKRVLAALLAAVMVAWTSCPIFVNAAQTEDSTKEAYMVGDVINGFKVTNQSYSSTYQSNVYTFEHEKTGAKLLWFENDDINRGFTISFRTPAENDKGISHIIEHSTIAGSEKYPDRNLFFSVSNNTYTSFINAMTSQNMTMYPVTSCSEEQLYKLTDIYLDCVFNPTLLTEEKIFEREAWRYELSDASSEIVQNGTVYNEMKGSLSDITTMAYYNAMKTIFEGTAEGTVSGGVPGEILNLSYEELIATYKKNYHPSNSLVILYGDIDCDKFLKLIDEDYFSNYVKKEVVTDRTETKETDELVKKSYTFPAANGSDTVNKSIIEYCMTLPDLLSIEKGEFAALSIAASLLNLENGSFMQALKASGIAESYSISFGTNTYQPVFMVIANNADETKADEFCTLAKTELQKTVKNGLDKNLVTSLIKSLRFSDVLSNEGSAGLSAMLQAAVMDCEYEDATANVTDYYYSIEQKLNDKYLEQCISKYLLQNKRQSLITTTPVAGLLEKNNAAQAKKLADYKASLSAKEIQKMVEHTKEFNEWNSQETSEELIDSMKAVSVDELPVEIDEYDTTDQDVYGARVVTSKAEIANISETGIYFDLSHLDKEELLYLQLYNNMLSLGMPAGDWTENQVIANMMNLTYGMQMALTVKQDYRTNEIAPSYYISFYAMRDEYKEAADFLTDVLLKTKLENAETYIKRAIDAINAAYVSVLADPLTVAMYSAAGYSNLAMRYQDYWGGLSFYEFIQDIEEQMQKDPQKVIEKLEEVRQKTFIRNGMSIAIAGDEWSLNAFNKVKADFVKQFPFMTVKDAEYELPTCARHQAYTTSSDVQYVVWSSDFTKSGVEFDGGMVNMCTMLNDGYLIPEIRFNGGAYGAGASLDESIFLVYTYRDANAANSIEVIDSMDKYIKSIASKLTDKDLESYILSTYAGYSVPSGELTGAFTSAIRTISHYDINELKEMLEQIKTAKASDYGTYVEMLTKLIEESNYVVVASPEYIEQHKDLFDDIIKLQ
ncbi:MAG: hypothetical protein E7256_08460 [Lachnospiraceae bacterium]|nr:hypothetical protein [Lachnospiraceae bacterium]